MKTIPEIDAIVLEFALGWLLEFGARTATADEASNILSRTHYRERMNALVGAGYPWPVILHLKNSQYRLSDYALGLVGGEHAQQETQEE